MKTVKIQGADGGVQVGKILCLGRNYAEHAKEMKSEVPTTPVVFLKPPSALLTNGEPIVRPAISHDMHHEVELIVLIGKNGKNVSAAKAREYVLGFGVGLDMTLRDVQAEAKKKGLPWSVAKGFDTSAPVSEIIPIGKFDGQNEMTIRCSVNGVVRQQTSTSKMIFSVEKIIEYVSGIFTLERGDVIFTGTPEGVGPVVPGDNIEAELAGFAKITHQVVAA
ncbi:MAG TPA: fumarylacetoacetate hydrolase family protein [Bacteroidota bacterium]|nr:fumarylacetoacetate hydrolase family protein [Bacteroidota bacterium]